jgi:hypothetical protein
MPPKRRTQRNRREESVNREARGENAPPPPPPPPPVMPGVAELVAQTNQLIATVLARLPPQNEHGEPREHRETIGCTSANFFRHNSPTFDGIAGPIAADHWLNGIQRLMVALKCTDEQKVNYAGLKLTGEAEYWWMSKQAMLILELGEDVPITWERFKQEFNDRFFPQEQRQMRAREFLALTQGDMNVEQYSNKFIELSRYAPNLVPNEETKVERFLCGLQSKIRGRVICHGIKEYTKLVDLASIAERSVNDESADEARKKRSAPPLMEIKAPLRRISFKYQLGRLREHEQRSSRMYSTDSFKSYGLKQIRGGPLGMIHVGNKESSP